eukprot:3217193-Rhodomonas_salina.1
MVLAEEEEEKEVVVVVVLGVDGLIRVVTFTLCAHGHSSFPTRPESSPTRSSGDYGATELRGPLPPHPLAGMENSMDEAQGDDPADGSHDQTPSPAVACS